MTALERLLAPDSPVEVVAVVTQPDRPAGRGRVMTPPPVKRLAQQQGLPVLQPATSLTRPAFLDAIRRFAPELGVVVAYGRILRPELLAIPRHGYLNVHASLLPRWRGAWPVGAAILAGDEQTGVSIMRLDEGMDTGPVLAMQAEPIRPDDTTGSLEARLATLGAVLLVETIPGYLSGAIVPQPQDDRAATYCRPVRRADALIDWSNSAVYLERQVRAMQPAPGAYTSWRGKQLLILRASVAPAPANLAASGSDEGRKTKNEGDSSFVPSPSLRSESVQVLRPASVLEPGTVVPYGKKAAVATGDGLLVLETVQLEGRSPTPIAAFRNGYRDFVGSRLGDPLCQ